jgi:hypothetical protein
MRHFAHFTARTAKETRRRRMPLLAERQARWQSVQPRPELPARSSLPRLTNAEFQASETNLLEFIKARGIRRPHVSHWARREPVKTLATPPLSGPITLAGHTTSPRRLGDQ